jgi:hypothetical protein
MAAQADPVDRKVPSGSLHDESHRVVQSIDSTENVNPACSKDAGSLPITAWASPRVLKTSRFSRGPNVRWSPKRGGDTHISRPLALTALITNPAGAFALLMPVILAVVAARVPLYGNSVSIAFSGRAERDGSSAVVQAFNPFHRREAHDSYRIRGIHPQNTGARFLRMRAIHTAERGSRKLDTVPASWPRPRL